MYTNTITMAMKNNNNATTNAQPRVICNIPSARSRILQRIKSKQKGLCWHCNRQITEVHNIVSRGKKPRYYYHKECAEKLNII